MALARLVAAHQAMAAATRVWRPRFGTEADVVSEGIGMIRSGWNG